MTRPRPSRLVSALALVAAAVVPVAVVSGMTAEREGKGIVPTAATAPVMPEALQGVLATYEAQREKAYAEAEVKLEPDRKKLIADLKTLLAQYAKEGKTAETGAVLKQLDSFMGTDPAEPLNDPGTLMAYKDRLHQTLYMKVTGALKGTVWGTGAYTLDSPVATAAIYAGVLEVTETAVLKVKILPGRSSYQGSTANGVTSENWGNFQGTYTLERVKAN